ncbi:MAG TPA: hypothetical protein VF548_02920 [Allosphingosinicella sp.]|jgi:hypothetical protein
MNILDVARSLGSDPLNAEPEAVAAFIRREFRNKGGTFNYNTSITSLPALFEGQKTVDEAVAFCLAKGSPAGRVQNANAIEIAGAYASSKRSKCYRIPFSAVPIGRLAGGHTAFMAIKAPLVRVKRPDIFVVVPGFRLGHRPRGTEIDVAASFAVATFARDDFHEADYEYLDCSRGLSGERELSVYQGRDRRLFTLDEVDHMLDIYVRGLAFAIQSGMPAEAPNFRGYKIIDPDQPRMV